MFKNESDRIVDAISVMVGDSVDEAMNRFNG